MGRGDGWSGGDTGEDTGGVVDSNHNNLDKAGGTGSGRGPGESNRAGSDIRYLSDNLWSIKKHWTDHLL